MLVVKQDNDKSVASSWKGVIRDGVRTAGMTCPNGHTASLSGHAIAADGKVSPSVVCPHNGCDFHEYVQLEGWSEKGVSVPADSKLKVITSTLFDHYRRNGPMTTLRACQDAAQNILDALNRLKQEKK